MANTLKIKRGTAATIPNGALAEPLFTSDTYDLYIGKGDGTNQRFQKYIASGTSSQFLKGDGSLDSNTYQTALTFSSPLVNTSGTISIPAATSSVNGYLTSTDWTTFNSKEPAITAGTTSQYYRGDKTFQTLDTAAVPENGAIYFTEPRVRATVLTGLNLSGGGTISASDSVLTAFGKVQNQISALVGGATYQGTWNANTNTPTLASGTGTKGYYYVVSVAGSTNLDGITDWKVGDWAIFNGTTWDKVDNTDAVSSVNGFTGAVNLGLGNISDVTLSSPTNAQLLRFNGTSSKWENWTPTYISAAITSLNGLTAATQTFAVGTSGTDFAISSSTSTHTFNLPTASATNRGALSSADWSTFNGKQAELNGTGFVKATGTTISYDNTSYLSLAGGTMTGQIVLKEGTDSTDYTKGLRFPNDPYGGSGDISGLRLYRDGAGTEKMVLELYIGNDSTGGSQDRINFRTGIGGTADNDLVTINDNKIWNAGNLTNPVTGTGTQNYIPKWNNAGGTSIGNSKLYDNGSTVQIGSTSVTDSDFSVLGTNTTSQSQFIADAANKRYLLVVRNNEESGAVIDMRSYGSSYTETIFGQTMANSTAILSQANSKFLIGNVSNKPIIFGTNDAERIRIDADGRLFVKTKTTYTTATNTIELAGNGTGSGEQPHIYIKSNTGTTDTHTGYLVFTRSTGSTDNAKTLVANNDRLGMIRFEGADGTNFIQGATILAEVDGTAATDDMPTRLVFQTTADGASSPTTRLTINNAGLATFTNIPAFGSASDAFVISDSGTLKTRTAAQVRSDIGAQATLTNPITGDGSETSGNIAFFTGNTTIAGTTSLNWDNANGRMTIGKASTDYRLEVYGGTKPQIVANGGNALGAGIALLTELSGTDRRNWIINTESTVAGDFEILRSTAAGGTPSVRSFAINKEGDIYSFNTFTVVSSATSGVPIYLDNSGRASGKRWGILNGNIANGTFSIKNETDNTTPFSISSTGAATFSSSVTANSQITMAYGGNPRLLLRDTDAGAGNVGILFREDTNDKWTLASVGGAFQFFNEATASNALYITSGNNVGIGTTAPISILHILGQSGTTGLPSLLLYGESPANGQRYGFNVSSDQLDISALGTNARIAFFTGGAANSITERMRITSGGNVGINCTPSYLLDVQTSGVTQARFRGSSTDAAIIRLENSTSTQTYGIGAAGSANLGGAPNNSFYIRDETANAVRLAITSGGQVYINTTSALQSTEQLAVTTASNSAIIAQYTGGATTGWAMKLWNNAASGNNNILEFTTEASITARGAIAYNRTLNALSISGSNALNFAANGGNRMLINSSGMISINEDSPLANMRLYINTSGSNISGTADWSSSNTRGIMLNVVENSTESVGIWFRTGGNHLSGISGQRSGATGTVDGWATDLRFYTHQQGTSALTTATERMRISPEGEVWIGYTGDQGGYLLQVNGSVLASAYYESSDIRLKDVLTNSYSENFSAIEFMWKDKRDDKKHWGYAAQDVMKYIPDAIEVNNDGMMTVNYNEAHTWKIAQLEAKIVELEAKLK